MGRRRTDVILERVEEELAKQRVWLDAMPDVRGIIIDIKMNKDTGLPRAVIIRTESEN